MPELPEVETIRRDLEKVVIGRRVRNVTVYAPEMVRIPDAETFVSELRGKTIEHVGRRAKYLLLFLDEGWIWAIHLMLEGQLLYTRADEPLKGETRLVVDLDNGHQLRVRDVVGFAKTSLVRGEEAGDELRLNLLGPEPLVPSFTFEKFMERLEKRRGMVKPLLLNQKVIAGIGNIYADEALYRARILPTRKVNTLSPEELHRLYTAIVETLREGVQARGTSAEGGMYRDLWGRKGKHQEHLRVFRREGEPCPDCGGKVQKTMVGGRETFLCPSCQH